MAEEEQERERMRTALIRVAVALKQSGVPFALAGGYAVWARGGPEPAHDVDFVVAEDDAGQAATALAESGLEVEHPPEDWLFKVYADGAMVDVFSRNGSEPARRALVENASEVEVLSVRMPVLSATDLVVQKLSALDEHFADFTQLLPTARALREQVDWAQVQERTAANDFAAAFLFLLQRLEVIAL